MREFLELKLTGSGRGREEKRRHFDLAAAAQLHFKTDKMGDPEPLELLPNRPAPYGQLQPLIGRFRRGYFTPSGIPYSRLSGGDAVKLSASSSGPDIDQALVLRRWAEPAIRQDWKTTPLPPEERLPLPPKLLQAVPLSDKGYRWLMLGFIPQEMEDKWFIYAEKPWLYGHRSWTGIQVFGARLAAVESGWQVVEGWVNGRREEVNFPSAEDGARSVLALLRSRLTQMEKIWDTPEAGVS